MCSARSTCSAPTSSSPTASGRAAKRGSRCPSASAAPRPASPGSPWAGRRSGDAMKRETVDRLVALAARVVESARAKGAEIAEVLAVDSLDLSAKVRMGAPELIEEAGSHALGLRVMKNGRWSSTYSSDPTETGIEALVLDALELAALSEPDEHSLPPDSSLLAKQTPDLDLFDPRANDLDAKTATRLALAGEQAARELDPRITNSEGASFDRTLSARALVTSGGFAGGYAGT